MKKLIALAAMILLSQTTLAKALDTPDEARKVKKQIASAVMQLEGVNGIGLTGCNPTTGQKDISGDFVYCVNIMTETQEAYEFLNAIYPSVTKVNGVIISVDYVGKIEMAPRMSGGNGG